MSQYKCVVCGDEGFIYREVPHYETVTRDMALDAQDPDIEGSQVVFGSEQIKEPCPSCAKDTK